MEHKTNEAMKKLPEKDFFFAYLPEFLDEQISDELMKKFQSLMKKPEYQTAAQLFRTQRDILQIQLRALTLSSENSHELRVKARSDELEEAVEGAEIETLKAKEGPRGQKQRWLVSAILLILCTAFLYTYFAKKEMGFDPIQALPYEALQMEEDTDLARLDLPSSDMQELASFFAKHAGLKFTPFMLKVPADWQALGATIIDYDVAKIAATRFVNTDTKEPLFHFAFGGRLEDLSPSSPGRIDQFIYQTYASDRINLIVWQQDPQTLGMLAGHLKAEDLAKLAVAGTSPDSTVK